MNHLHHGHHSSQGQGHAHGGHHGGGHAHNQHPHHEQMSSSSRSSRHHRPRSQVMTLGTSSESPPPPPQRKNGSLPQHQQHQRWYENEGELKERQLQELKTRMRQMEKTMRWWSDCATNWREKWSQLRIERNHVKEDLVKTQTELERVSRELDHFRGGGRCSSSSAGGGGVLCTPTPTTPNPSNGRVIMSSTGSAADHLNSFQSSMSSGGSSSKNKRIQTDPVDYLKTDEVVRLEKSVTRYLLMLEEANRTIIAEREDKIILHHTVERLQRDLQDLQELYDNLKKEMYELKDFSEMDESFCLGIGGGERDDRLLHDDDDDGPEDEEYGLSGDEEEVQVMNGGVGAAAAVGGFTSGLHLETHGRRSPRSPSPLNFQTSLLIDLADRRPHNHNEPILQIVEDNDVLRDQEEQDQAITTVVSRSCDDEVEKEGGSQKPLPTAESNFSESSTTTTRSSGPDDGDERSKQEHEHVSSTSLNEPPALDHHLKNNENETSVTTKEEKECLEQNEETETQAPTTTTESSELMIHEESHGKEKKNDGGDHDGDEPSEPQPRAPE